MFNQSAEKTLKLTEGFDFSKVLFHRKKWVENENTQNILKLPYNRVGLIDSAEFYVVNLNL